MPRKGLSPLAIVLLGALVRSSPLSHPTTVCLPSSMGWLLVGRAFASLSFHTRLLFVPSRSIVPRRRGRNSNRENRSASISMTQVADTETGRAWLERLACGFAAGLHSHFIPGGAIYDVI